MKYTVSILPQAESDLERNARWWAEHHSVELAAKWLHEVRAQILSLSELPESKAVSPENGGFPYEIRDKLLGLGSRPSHRAVFTIRDDTVFVLTVRHAAQDRLRTDDATT